MSEPCENLLEAYRHTTYWVIAPGAYVPVRIGLPHDEIDRLLQELGRREWAVVTAANPLSKPQTPAENETRNAILRRELEERGFTFYRALGVGDDRAWAPEDSFFVAGIGKDDAIALGRKYEQCAVVIGGRGEAAVLALCGNG